MPNRMLRDWTRSVKMKDVDPLVERFFIRLIMKADDYGCYYADPSLLKADLFPFLLNTVREADISRWTAACQKAGLIVLYEREGKKYLQINNFNQRLDKARPKFPLPDPTDFPEVVNEFPAELETEVEVEKESISGAPAAPPVRHQDGIVKKKTRTSFIAPTHPELQNYFLKKVGESWGEDRARREASECFDHYEANGWVQGKGKPIVNWMAAARNWIRREMSGDFSDRPVAGSGRKDPPTSQILPPLQPKPSAPVVSEAEKVDQSRSFIEDVFQDFLAGTMRIELISGAAYDILKREGLMNTKHVPVDAITAKAKEIRLRELRASDSPADKKLAEQLLEYPDTWKTDAPFTRHAKGLSLVHFFEDLKKKHSKTVFDAKATV